MFACNFASAPTLEEQRDTLYYPPPARCSSLSGRAAGQWRHQFPNIGDDQRGMKGKMWTDAQGARPYPVPDEMTVTDIQMTIAEYVLVDHRSMGALR